MIPVIFVSSEPSNTVMHHPVGGAYLLPRPFHGKDLLYAAQRLLSEFAMQQDGIG